MSQIKCKKIQSLQDLIASCKRNGQGFKLQMATLAMCKCDSCRCDGRNMPRQ